MLRMPLSGVTFCCSRYATARIESDRNAAVLLLAVRKKVFIF